jgi:hypothetical protein
VKLPLVVLQPQGDIFYYIFRHFLQRAAGQPSRPPPTSPCHRAQLQGGSRCQAHLHVLLVPAACAVARHLGDLPAGALHPLLRRVAPGQQLPLVFRQDLQGSSARSWEGLAIRPCSAVADWSNCCCCSPSCCLRNLSVRSKEHRRLEA